MKWWSIKTHEIAKTLSRSLTVCSNRVGFSNKLPKVSETAAAIAYARHPFSAWFLSNTLVPGRVVSPPSSVHTIKLMCRFSQIGARIIAAIATAMINLIRPTTALDEPNNPCHSVRASAYADAVCRRHGPRKPSINMVRYIRTPLPCQQPRCRIVVENRADELGGEIITPWGWHTPFYAVAVEA